MAAAQTGGIPQCLYNYLKDRKAGYRKRKAAILEKIEEIYHKYHGKPGHRMMQSFLKKEGIFVSKTMVQKYMNRILKLHSITHRHKPVYRSAPQHKVFKILYSRILLPLRKIVFGVPISHISVLLMGK